MSWTLSLSAARRIAGVRDVLRLDNAVAVVGDHFWAAKQGLDAFDIDSVFGPNAGLNQAQIVKGYADASSGDGIVARLARDALDVGRWFRLRCPSRTCGSRLGK